MAEGYCVKCKAKKEMQNAEEKLGIVSSRGQKAAWVLQNKFIGKDPLKLCDDLQAFLVSRDVKATVEEKKIKDVTFLYNKFEFPFLNDKKLK